MANDSPAEKVPNPVQVYGDPAVPLPVQVEQVPVELFAFASLAVQDGGMDVKLLLGQLMATVDATPAAISELLPVPDGVVTGIPPELFANPKHLNGLADVPVPE